MLTRARAKRPIFRTGGLVSGLPNHRSIVSRLLFIVARSAPERYDFLRYAFACDEHVDVIFDRRRSDRRHEDRPHPIERRRAERRTHDVLRELQRQGYAVIRRA